MTGKIKHIHKSKRGPGRNLGESPRLRGMVSEAGRSSSRRKKHPPRRGELPDRKKFAGVGWVMEYMENGYRDVDNHWIKLGGIDGA